MNVGYFLIMWMSLLVGYRLSRRTQQNLQLPPWQRIGIAAGAFTGAMIGAKIPFLFDSWEAFMSGATWFNNGKTILTGLVGGYLGVEIAKWVFEVKSKTGDSFVVPVAAAIAIGRLGCFYAGCCFGMPTDLPWGVVFATADSLHRHPTQIYEFIFHASSAVFFYWLDDQPILKTHRIKLYIIAYAIYRFLTEFIRPEFDLYWGLTGYQLCSLVIIGLFAWLWYRDSQLSVDTESSHREIHN
jgi:prolipoprotein diacylglyceryltransferase